MGLRYLLTSGVSIRFSLFRLCYFCCHPDPYLLFNNIKTKGLDQDDGAQYPRLLLLPPLRLLLLSLPDDNALTGETAVPTALEAGLITLNTFAITVEGT